jgi:hypothetical protein
MAEFETDRMKKLKAQRAAIDARLRQEQLKLNAKERARDTRRKVLAGAAVLEKARRDEDFSRLLIEELKSFLSRDDERALFNMPPVHKKMAS